MVTEVKDYVDRVLKKFPYLTKSEINKIITYGLKRYAWANRRHADVLICYRNKNDKTDKPLTMYSGFLKKDPLESFQMFLVKSRIRERLLDVLLKKEWDGYYYLGLTQELHDAVMNLGKTKTFKPAYFTKLKKELYHLKYVKHIWRVPYIADCGYRFYRSEFKTNKADYIGENHYERYLQCFLGRNKSGLSSSDAEAIDTD